jgi:signal transduction histidine kinase
VPRYANRFELISLARSFVEAIRAGQIETVKGTRASASRSRIGAARRREGRIGTPLRGCTEALVADDGPGEPEHERQRVFDRFVRLDPSKPGHGLGLAIARRIAQQHDGNLPCDATPHGAILTLSLPTEP